MNPDQYIDEPLYEALQDTSWAINRGVLPVYSLLQNLSPAALQELEWAQYQIGVMADYRSEGMGV